MKLKFQYECIGTMKSSGKFVEARGEEPMCIDDYKKLKEANSACRKSDKGGFMGLFKETRWEMKVEGQPVCQVFRKKNGLLGGKFRVDCYEGDTESASKKRAQEHWQKRAAGGSGEEEVDDRFDYHVGSEGISNGAWYYTWLPEIGERNTQLYRFKVTGHDH